MAEINYPKIGHKVVQVWDCPNPMNRVKVELRRVKE